MIPELKVHEKEEYRKETDKYKFIYLGPWLRNTILIQICLIPLIVWASYIDLRSIFIGQFVCWLISSGVLWLYAADRIEDAYKGKFKLSPQIKYSRKQVLYFIAYCWVWALLYYLTPSNRELIFTKKSDIIMQSEIVAANEILNSLRALPQTPEVKIAITKAQQTISDLQAVDQQKKDDEAGIIAYHSFQELEKLHERAMIAQTIQKELMESYHKPQLDALRELGPQVVKSEVVRPDPTRKLINGFKVPKARYYKDLNEIDVYGDPGPIGLSDKRGH